MKKKTLFKIKVHIKIKINTELVETQNNIISKDHKSNIGKIS